MLNQKAWMLGLVLTTGQAIPMQAVAAEGTNDVTEVQQAKQVTGRVSDSQGALIGATVLEKGTSNGTVTDIDGRFTLNVKPSATLVITYVGYVSQELKASANLSNIVLKEDGHVVNEVVVIGYNGFCGQHRR